MSPTPKAFIDGGASLVSTSPHITRGPQLNRGSTINCLFRILIYDGLTFLTGPLVFFSAGITRWQPCTRL